jgi:hypothetical protein
MGSRATSFKNITKERPDMMENLREGTHGNHEGRSGPEDKGKKEQHCRRGYGKIFSNKSVKV